MSPSLYYIIFYYNTKLHGGSIQSVDGQIDTNVEIKGQTGSRINPNPFTAESDDQHSVTSPEQPEPQYTEVQIRKVNPDRGEAPGDYYFQFPHKTVIALMPLELCVSHQLRWKERRTRCTARCGPLSKVR